ncbi:unnamed protein product, partial [Pleuronectes platessa]
VGTSRSLCQQPVHVPPPDSCRSPATPAASSQLAAASCAAGQTLSGRRQSVRPTGSRPGHASQGRPD